MKKIIIKMAVLLAALVLQFTLIQRLKIFGFSANICVLALIGISFFSSPGEAAFYGGLIGMLMDGAAARGFGVGVLLCMYLSVGVKLIASEKINNSPALMAGYVWLFTLLYYLAYGLMSLAVPRGSISVGRWLLTALVTAVINSVLSLPLLWAADRLKRGGAKA